MPSSNNPVIHVIDDDEAVRESLEALLLAAGFTPRTYGSAEEFLAGSMDRTGCLLLDMNMPGMGGLELLKNLAANGRSIPTVVLTASREEAIRTRAHELGVRSFLLKPATQDDLLGALIDAAGGHADPGQP